MAKWFFDSNGTPIVFLRGNKVFSKSGDYIGRLKGNEVWHGSYKGEIVKGNRFLYRTTKGSVVHSPPSTPAGTSTPSSPSSKPGIALPSGYRDVQL